MAVGCLSQLYHWRLSTSHNIPLSPLWADCTYCDTATNSDTPLHAEPPAAERLGAVRYQQNADNLHANFQFQLRRGRGRKYERVAGAWPYGGSGRSQRREQYRGRG